MNKFTELAMVLSERGMSQVDQELQAVKTQKQMTQSVFDQQIAQLNSVKAQQKMEAEKVKAEQKQEKMQKDLMKAMIESGQGQQPMAIGGDMVGGFATQGQEEQQVEPEAMGLPVIDGMQ